MSSTPPPDPLADRTARLEAALTYRFADARLLTRALVHRSAPNEQPHRHPDSNERLEFLGDAVLDLCIARVLFDRYPDADEGELTRYKAALVSETALAERARTLDLGDCLVLGRGEVESDGRNKPSILADALEAVLGAVYLDGGWGAVEPVVHHLFAVGIDRVPDASAPRGDYKTALQEWTQAQGLGLPTYQTVDTEGPDHARIYTIRVLIGERERGRGRGPSKREAERLAAATAYRAVAGSVTTTDT